jgi:hypothetical protein
MGTFLIAAVLIWNLEVTTNKHPQCEAFGRAIAEAALNPKQGKPFKVTFTCNEGTQND